MRRKIRIISLCLLLCLISYLPGVAFAAKYENYITHDVSEQEKSDFLQNIEFMHLETEAKGNAFSSFAVSEQGQIALCFNSQNALINVYDSNGLFLYGFQFVNGASALAVFFEGETLSILWGKNQYIGSFDAEGNCLNFQRFNNTKSNSDSYNNDRYRPSTGQVGDKQYFAEKIGLSPNYTKFAVEDELGNRTVIYDVTKEAYTTLIVTCLFAPLLPTFILYTARQQKKEGQKQNAESVE